MSEHQLGKNEQLDKEYLAQKAKEGLSTGSKTKLVADHDKLQEEMFALLAITKMDRHWKILMGLIFSGFHIEDALMMAQKNGFLVGVSIREAILIEAAAKGKLMDELGRKGAEHIVEEQVRNMGGGKPLISTASPAEAALPNKEEKDG